MIGNLRPSLAVSAADRMYSPESAQHYFYVGRSDLLTIFNVLNIRSSYFGGDAPVKHIYDFGCGHGRVARWLRAAFAEAEIYVTDLDRTGVGFCETHFRCRNTAGEIPQDQFDLVWLGSVFTHLPEYVAEPLLYQLCASLRYNGVLVFTSQGRYSVERMRDFDWGTDQRHWMHYSIEKERFESVVSAYHKSGYGYVDYHTQSGYGVCISSPNWYSDRILRRPDFLQILFQEKGSDNHQDVSAFMRADLLDSKKGPLW